MAVGRRNSLVGVGADPILTHPADPILTRGWTLAARGPTVDKCRSMPGLSTSLMACCSRGGGREGRRP
jgi:hypothetical protein